MKVGFIVYMENAISKYIKDPHMRTSHEISQLEVLTNKWNYTVKEILWSRMIVDLAVNPFYKSLARWMDSDNGLAKNYPKEMEEVAKLFLKNGN